MEKLKVVSYINTEDLARPMRASTPTDSVSTIEAGNIDETLDDPVTPQKTPLNDSGKKDYIQTEDEDSDNEVFEQFTKRIRERERQKILYENRKKNGDSQFADSARS